MDWSSFPPHHMWFKLLRKTRSNGFLKQTWFSYITHKHKCVNGFLLSIEWTQYLRFFRVLMKSHPSQTLLPSLCSVPSVLNCTMTILPLYFNTAIRSFIMLLEYCVKDQFRSKVEPHGDRKWGGRRPVPFRMGWQLVQRGQPFQRWAAVHIWGCW